MKIALILAAATCLLSPRVFAEETKVPGTLFFQYATGEEREAVPGRDFASRITRLSPPGGPGMVGLSCYGLTFDPNTNQMCFVRGRNFGTGDNFHNRNVFYLCNLDGSNVRLLERERVDYSGFSELSNDYTPSFTSDGHILFQTEDRIARMNGDGSNVVFLSGAKEQCGTPQQRGERIVFEKDGVCVMNLDGTGRKRIASFPTFYGSPGVDGQYSDAQLSPDGKFVAFARGRQIFVTEVDNPGNARRVSGRDARFQIGEFSDPVWSPDGRFLAVAGGQEDSRDLFLLELESGKMTQLTQTPGKDERPCDWDETR